MSFILEFSVEANVGYFVRKYLGPAVSNMIKVVNHFQVDDLDELGKTLRETYGELTIVDSEKNAATKYIEMLNDCKEEALRAASDGNHRFTIARADHNVSVEVRYYEEAVQ